MPLNPSSLANDLSDIYDSDNRLPVEAAQKYSQAIISYWESGTAPGQGIVTAIQTFPVLFQGLSQAYSQNRSVPLIAAQITATAMNTALLSVIITGGLYGVGPITTLGLPVLINDLENIYSNTTEIPTQAAQQEAQAIHKFTTNTICFGTGVEAPTPIPKIGPLQ